MRELLARRDARRYLAGQVVSMFGDRALWLAMGVWVKELTGSSGAAGLVFLAFVAPQLLSPLAGVLVDRLPRRPLLIATNVAAAVCLLPLLAVHDRGDVWIVYAVMAVHGTAFAVLGAGQSALLPALLPDRLLGPANAVLSTAGEGLRLLAPLAGAAIFAWLGGAAVAVCDATTFLAAAAVIASVRVAEPVRAVRRGARRVVADMREGFAFAGGSPQLRLLLAGSALSITAFGLSESVMFAVVDDGLHRPASFLGVLIACQGGGAVAAGLAAAPLLARVGELRLCTLGMATAAAGAVMCVAPWLAVVVAGKVLTGASLPWIVVGAMTLLQRTRRRRSKDGRTRCSSSRWPSLRSWRSRSARRSSGRSATACCSALWRRCRCSERCGSQRASALRSASPSSGCAKRNPSCCARRGTARWPWTTMSAISP